MWERLKHIAPITGSLADSMGIPQHLISDPNKINDFFLDVPGSGNIDACTLDFYKTNKLSDTTFRLSTTTESDVLRTISTIRTNACGHDSISAEMLRMALPVTLPIIIEKINVSTSVYFQIHEN